MFRFALALALPLMLQAHCDTLDGPVVKAAAAALDAADVRPVLIWIQPADEPAVRAAFEKTLAVRKLGPEPREFADRYFFETLVRIHRAGEGAPYTGLKPAEEIAPAIAAADKAAETGSADALAAELARAAATGIRDRFARLQRARALAGDSVAQGRAYVRAYVEFLHYVDALEGAAAGHSGH
jgi:hypothetical protein